MLPSLAIRLGIEVTFRSYLHLQQINEINEEEWCDSDEDCLDDDQDGNLNDFSRLQCGRWTRQEWEMKKMMMMMRLLIPQCFLLHRNQSTSCPETQHLIF